MAQKIYKLFLGKMSEAWHQLSQEEQEGLLAREFEAREQAGGKAMLLCNSAWSSEQWPFFGIEEFPDTAAVQRFTELLEEFNWGRYVDSMTLLGTEWPSS